MSQILTIPLGPQSDPARSKYMGEPVITNGFVEKSQEGKTQYAIYGDMGLIDFTTFTEGPMRGCIQIGARLYVVAGETLWRVAADGTKTLIGDILGEHSVIFARNANVPPEIIIVADTTVYHLQNDVLQVFPDNDLPIALVVSATFIAQRIVFLLSDARFFWSDVNNADSVDALNFKTAEARPDGGVRNITVGGEMWVMGEETVEIYGLSTDASDPFPRLSGGFIPCGTRAKHSVCLVDNNVNWVNDKGLVVRGQQAARISNYGVERDIQRMIDAQTVSQIEAFGYSEGGHEFYQVSGTDWTWRHDFSNGTWQKKESLGNTRSKIHHYCRAFDKHLVGDMDAAALYQMKFGVYDESGDELTLGIKTPIMDEQGYYILWDSVIVDAELGVGSGTDTAAPEYNPRMMLTWSDDAGHTWSVERERPLGKQGNWKGRVMFNQLGQSKEQGRMFNIRISAPVKKTILQAKARVRLVAAQGMVAA